MNLTEALAHPVLRAVHDVARSTGHRAYAIGGYVRDLFLERPSKDIDIVVEGDGLIFARAFAAHIRAQKVALFENFRTAMVRMGDFEVEFVGARKESYRRDSRKPIVEGGSLLDDQLRRDFTINALSISLNAHDYGQIFDPFGGLDDLKRKLIRTPTRPEITFDDDPLRMMRAIRFAAQLDFTIDPETYAAIYPLRDRLPIVSQERITDELNKMVMSPVPSAGFKLLFNTELLHQFFPEMVKLFGVETINGKSHKDNFYHTLQVLDNLSRMTDDLWLRWGAILHDIAKPATKRFDPVHGWTFHGHEDRGARMVPKIFNRLRLPQNEKMRFVEKLVKLHLRPIALVDEIVTDSAVRRLIVDAGEDLEALMMLCRADITTRDTSKMKRILRNFDAVEAKIREIEEKDRLRNWQPPLSGEEIMSEFRLPPGREVGIIKTAVREAILDGEIPNEHDAALSFARNKARELGLL